MYTYANVHIYTYRICMASKYTFLSINSNIYIYFMYICIHENFSTITCIYFRYILVHTSTYQYIQLPPYNYLHTSTCMQLPTNTIHCGTLPCLTLPYLTCIRPILPALVSTCTLTPLSGMPLLWVSTLPSLLEGQWRIVDLEFLGASRDAAGVGSRRFWRR